MAWFTLPVALASVGGASTATQLYSTKKASGINKRSIAAQRESEAEALAIDRRREEAERVAEENRLAMAREDAALAREQMAASERARQEDLAFNQSRWNDYVRIK